MGPLSLACSRLARQRNRHEDKLHVSLFLSKRIFHKSVMVIWRALPKRVQTTCLLLLQWCVSCFKAFFFLFLMKFYKSYVSLFLFNISFIYIKKNERKNLSLPSVMAMAMIDPLSTSCNPLLASEHLQSSVHIGYYLNKICLMGYGNNFRY